MKASRRDFLKLCGANAAAVGLGTGPNAASLSAGLLQALRTESDGAQPNIIYYQVDNLGYGELGCYGGGILRGAPTQRIDQFAGESLKLLNFAPEAQCTPSRSALSVQIFHLSTSMVPRVLNRLTETAHASANSTMLWYRLTVGLSNRATPHAIRCVYRVRRDS